MEYINDKIPVEDLDKWIGKKILISAQTGTGKSHFVKTKLYDYCVAHNYKILLLSNRTILRNQNIEELEGKMDIIYPINYQKIENGVVQTGEDLDYYLHRFDVIVFDEAHHMFSDSEFNRTTDILLETLYKDYPNKMFLFITATPEVILEFQPNFDFVYTMKKDYSYIKNLYFYNRANTPESIVQNLGLDEKIIFFSNDAQEAYQLSTKFDNSAFVCSESNNMYKYSNQKTVLEIVEKSFFSERLLCTTKVMDNGISILDSSVRHIILDSLDLITLIQCLGRRRTSGKEDKVNVYIRDYHAGNINYALMIINAKLQNALDLTEVGVEEFQFTHRKKSFHDVIDNDFKINKAKLQQYQYKKDLFERLKKISGGYRLEVIKYLGVREDIVKNADNEFEKIGMKAYLNTMKHKKFYKEEQEEFKIRFFSLLFSPKNTNYRNRGIRSINAILEEDNIPYRVESGQDKKGENRNKRWWAIIDFSSFEND